MKALRFLHTFTKFKQLDTFKSQHLLLSTIRRAPDLKIENEQKNVLENVVPKILLDKKIETTEDWLRVRNEILNFRYLNSKTVDSAVLAVCTASKNYQLGLDYVEFLKSQKMPLGLATVGKYFKLIYFKNNPKNLEESEEVNVYNLYQELRKVYKVLDGSTIESLIHVLSLTKYWRECLNLLDEVKISCAPSSALYSVIVAACFKNNEKELGWSFLKECSEKGRFPTAIAYSAYIDLCERTQDLDGLEKLFQHIHTYDIKWETETANKIVNIYKKFNLNADVVTFKNNVRCRNCYKQLQKMELKDEEFDDLKKAIFKNVILGSNVFYKTTPKELEDFKQFVTNMKSYDVIIDGLNVAYSAGTKQPSHVFAFLVKSVVQHFVAQKKKVLVLGRTHMQRWAKSDWSYVVKNADIFLTQTLSHDDPYLLYCALNSGKNTIVVSRDLMRNYIFKLNEAILKVLFSRWLSQCQYQLLHVNGQGKVFFKYPLAYARTAQKIENIWHIPCDDPTNNNEAVHKWLCIKN